MTPEIIYCEYPEDVADAAASVMLELQKEAIAERGVFRIALSGGSTPKELFQLLASEHWRDEFEWPLWEVFWSDERAVPKTSKDSNFKLAQDHLLSKVPVGEVFPMLANSDNLHEAADSYARTLRSRFLPEAVMFDCILLGMGTDGHTASLFPGTPLLESGALVEAVEVANNPLPNRLTFTLRVLNSARACVFLVTGEEKAKRVFEVLKEEDFRLPATRVNPDEGRLIWILDEDASSELYE